MFPTTFFTPAEAGTATLSDEEVLIPTPAAMSLWAPNTLSGPAVAAVAARAVERGHSRDGFRPARFTLDLFKAARDLPTTTHSRVTRDGGRIRVVEVDLLQFTPDAEDPVQVARASVVFLAESQNPSGSRWSAPEPRFNPPATEPDDPFPWFATEDGEWSQDFGRFQHDRHKKMWTKPLAVADLAPTPFERAVIGAESASLVTNWGTGGISFINCDLTVALARLPIGERIGLSAASHMEVDGISLGHADLYDEFGKFGIASVTAVNNEIAMIDFTQVDWEERRSAN